MRSLISTMSDSPMRSKTGFCIILPLSQGLAAAQAGPGGRADSPFRVTMILNKFNSDKTLYQSWKNHPHRLAQMCHNS
jgi:hypothetical protein